MNEPTHMFHSASISSIERMKLWGFIPLGVWFAKKFWRERGIPRELLRDPREFFPFSRRALTSASVKYWGLALPPTADPPSGCVPSWLPAGGTLSLISYVLPSLRRRTSCSRSFNIAVILAMRSGSCLACLCSDTTSCSTKGIAPPCLKATSFSPTGLEAVGGTLVPLLFLCLGGILCEGIASSLFFAQSLVESPKM